jgi:hypothetical protein
MFTGTIVAFDPADGLGEVRLDDGRTVRFSLRACGPLKPDPGLRVIVQGLGPGFGGKLRAACVRPATSRPTDTILVWPEPWVGFEEGAHWESSDRQYVRFDPRAFREDHPEWVKATAARDLLMAVDVEVPISVHEDVPPMFAPWASEMAESAGAALRLRFGNTGEGMSRVFATSASLEGPWPVCSSCEDPLSLVLYLSGSDFPVLENSDTYFAAFLCTTCSDEMAMGEASWRFELGTPRRAQVQPSRREKPKVELPPEHYISFAPVQSYPDPRTLAGLPGAASQVLSVIVRRQPIPRAPLPRGKERRAPASVLYREWLHVDGRCSQLGGYLNWRHDLDGQHPTCRSCNSRMRLFCALSEEDSGMPLGDDVGGTLYFLFCDRTPDCARFGDMRVVHQFE